MLRTRLQMALFAVLVGSGALAKCPTIMPGDFHPCAKCVGNNGQNGEDTCVWCYSSQACLPMSGLGNPCPQRKDFSLFGDDCDCRPGQYTDCDSCTAQPGCIWINEGQKNWTIAVAGITFPPFATDIGQTCVRGSPIGPETQGAEFVGGLADLNVLKVAMVPDIQHWCWGQCKIQGVWFLVIVVSVTILALVVLVLLYDACSGARASPRHGCSEPFAAAAQDESQQPLTSSPTSMRLRTASGGISPLGVRIEDPRARELFLFRPGVSSQRLLV
eukprot:CAMPEP_0198206290 /NCGR_PEP_ID=MMETSP1445-20131203/9823_1 /TAXON_ID=36898 /ORGANISM="Pyramimonas sp., Strain CCMP2087" /LENGTH=272 /DNA_ID=CAMNT_0043878931 /DNA_START=120 /DNA_END=939 /DNA_ORIENTATION=-